MVERRFDQSRAQTVKMEDHLGSQLSLLSTQHLVTSNAAQREAITQSKTLDDLRLDSKSFQQDSRDWHDRIHKTSRTIQEIG